MIQTCKLTLEGAGGKFSHDMKAIQHQVSEDQKLLREKLLHLSGVAGIDRMEYALSETRSTYFGVKDDGSPVGSPMILSMPTSPTPLSTTASSSETNISYESNDRASRVVRSLFKETNTSPGESNFSSPRTSSDSQLGTSSEKLLVENEVLVNEFLHEHHYSVIDEFDVSDHIQNNVEGKIKQTMEKAFWDGIMENEAGVVGLASFSSHDMGTVAWVVNYEIYPLWYSIYAGICVVYHL
ncbi:hypothetical protein GLYMA_02G216350v4 [Glycine max]|nr:hypothetical protein GLYMA_02G216350v4 [Glycine max]KAH1061483.1 hypothetical protein GYH30_004799 [Glycine max]